MDKETYIKRVEELEHIKQIGLKLAPHSYFYN